MMLIKAEYKNSFFFFFLYGLHNNEIDINKLNIIKNVKIIKMTKISKIVLASS